MRSFRKQIDNRRQVYLGLVGSIESQLRQAYAKRHAAGEDTQASLGKKLGVDRSVIHRRLTGRSNMTIETLADMIWALGQCIDVQITDAAVLTNRKRIAPEPPPAFRMENSQLNTATPSTPGLNLVQG